MKRIVELINNFNELVAFKHTIFSLPFIFIAMITASNGFFGWELLILGLFSAITARNFAMGVNRYLDIDIDIKNPRIKNRPSVDGRVSKKSMMSFIILNAVGFITITYFINILAFKLSIPFLIIFGGYSYFKRFSALAHLILGLSLGLAPIAGVIAVSETIPLWSIFLAMGVMFWVAGFDLLYSLQDIEFDKKEGLFSIPSIYGFKKTMNISKVFHTLTIMFWLLFTIYSNGGVFVYIAILASAIMLTYEHILVNRDFKKIDRAFFTINGYLGIMFLIFIIIDEVV